MPRIIKRSAVIIDGHIFNPEISKEFNPSRIEEGIEHSSEQKAETPTERSERIIRKAMLEADAIIDEAKTEANSILSEAAESAARDAEVAYKTNKEKGYNDGYSKGEKEANAIIKKANAELDSAIAERNRIREQMEPEIFNLIVSILEKIFGNASAINPSIVMYLIKQGLSETTATGNAVVKVSVDDYDIVMENRALIMASAATELEIVQDLSLKKSDCIIETPFGDIDASLGHQFETLINHLKFIFDNR